MSRTKPVDYDALAASSEYTADQLRMQDTQVTAILNRAVDELRAELQSALYEHPELLSEIDDDEFDTFKNDAIVRVAESYLSA